MSKDKKILNPLLSGTLFKDGVPMDYLTQFRGVNPWPTPAALIMVQSAIKLGYNVVYINLGQ